MKKKNYFLLLNIITEALGDNNIEYTRRWSDKRKTMGYRTKLSNVDHPEKTAQFINKWFGTLVTAKAIHERYFRAMHYRLGSKRHVTIIPKNCVK